MKWPWQRRTEPAPAVLFLDRLDEVIEDFDAVVKEHRAKLDELRSALRDG